MDTGAVSECLTELADHGIVYDHDAEVLLVKPMCDQYAQYSRTNRNRHSGVNRYLGTLPPSPLLDYAFNAYGLKQLEAEGVLEVEGATSQVTSEVTSQVTSKVTSITPVSGNTSDKGVS